MKRLLLAACLLCCCSVANAAEPLFEFTFRLYWPSCSRASNLSDRPQSHRDPLVEAMERDNDRYEHWLIEQEKKVKPRPDDDWGTWDWVGGPG